MIVNQNELTFSQKRKQLAEKKKKKKLQNQNYSNSSPSQAELNMLLEHYQKGRYSHAEKLAVEITQQYPHHQFGWKVLGAILKTTGRVSEALTATQESVNLAPQDAEAHNNLGSMLKELGRLDEAVASYRQALTLRPSYEQAHYQLGYALNDLGRLEEAEASYRQAITLRADYGEAHNNLGITLQAQGRLAEAEASYRKAIIVKPDHAKAHFNLGHLLGDFNRLEEAELKYREAIVLKPDYAKAYRHLGGLMRAQNKLDDALTNYDRAAALDPDIDYLLGDTLFARQQLCEWDDLSQNLDELTRRVNSYEPAAAPLLLHALLDNPDIHKKGAKQFSEHKAPKSTVLPSITPYPHHKKVRVGYFSPDFKNHPVASLTAGLFENHDRATFEIHAFSFGPDTNDKLNLRIKAGVDHFHDVRTLSDKEVALLARSLELDIAVDLAGFTEGHRTSIFAMSAAPVQLSYIGFAGTMGADYYDYLIADSILIPEENKDYYNENIVYLPSYQVNSSQDDFQEIPLDKQYFGIPEGAFVFCCFNNTYKITPDAFDTWASILNQVEGSVLMLFADTQRAIKNLQKQIGMRGIDPNRLIFGGRLTGSEYQARYQVVDLFLDTFPCNGGATLSDALRMGCPILTCMGDSFSSRMGASLLTALDMPEFITTTQTQYEEMAADFAANPKRLKALREKLKSNIHTTPLYDIEQFTRSLEASYLVMYDRCQKGGNADDIYI